VGASFERAEEGLEQHRPAYPVPVVAEPDGETAWNADSKPSSSVTKTVPSS
jgi:hypothetical protein